MKSVTIVDTGICNVTSVINAFKRIGCEVKATNSKEEISTAAILVLPGVGSYHHGMKSLEKYDLIDALRERVTKDKIPFLGICLGMQLLAETSSENGNHNGLGMIAGHVRRLETSSRDYRIPNMGWYDVISDKKGAIFKDINSNSTYYHVHSYYFDCDDESDIAGHINFDGKDITVAIERDNVFGVQFHPEKSQDDGLNLLMHFMHYIDGLKFK